MVSGKFIYPTPLPENIQVPQNPTAFRESIPGSQVLTRLFQLRNPIAPSDKDCGFIRWYFNELQFQKFRSEGRLPAQEKYVKGAEEDGFC